ncbi:hypothetical protein [Paenibacillus sp. GCM10027626]|uniref:hypothetical protein n=1 Tax=Paenibacillus sp. GCM10027626 TaxID=3273411 RepID=UPI00363A89D5
MRRFRKYFSIFIMIGLLAAFSSNAIAGSTMGNGISNSNLQYFGYYHMDGYQTPDPQYLPFVGQLESSNVAVFSSWSRGATLREHLDLADDNGMKVLLNVYDFFFSWNPGGMGDGSGALHASWQTYWNDLKQTLSGYEDKLLGFYFDEPWWCGVSEADFRMVTEMIRNDYPDKKIVSISAVLDFDPQNTGHSMSSNYIEFVTDVGLDYYADDWETGIHDHYLQQLKNVADQNQQIWLVPKAFSRNSNETAQLLQKHLLNNYKIAMNEPRVIGIVPFTMPTGGDWDKGLYEFMDPANPSYDDYLKNIHIQVGKAVLNPASNNLFIHSIDTAGSGNGWSRQGTDIKWTAPKAGKIQISSVSSLARNGNGSNTVNVKMMKGNTQIWPASGWQSVGQATALYPRAETTVAAGDVIRFRVSGSGKKVNWDPVIIYTGER